MTVSILLAEDQSLNQMHIKGILERAGYAVAIADNGLMAVEALMARPGHFDLVLMDIQMPVMDGLEASRQIRQLPPPVNKINIIALSADDDAAALARYKAAGIDSHVAKPVVTGDLLRAVHGLSPRRPPEQTPENAALFDPAQYARLARNIGPEKALHHAVKLVSELKNKFNDNEDWLKQRQPLSSELHKLASTAGNIGLMQLSLEARRLMNRVIDLDVQECRESLEDFKLLALKSTEALIIHKIIKKS